MTSNFKLTFIEFYRRYLRPRRRVFFVMALVVVGAVFFWHGGTALAEGKDATSPVTIPLTPDTLLSLLTRILLLITQLFLSITIFILSFVIEIAGYNGFLTSTAVSVGWVMVRDITNMGFVVILLIIAFGTILGLEQYEWKKLLVKFVLAAILVNFSRIICGVIIDIAQVVMITFVNGVAATAGGNLINAFGLTQIQSLSQGGARLNDSSIFLAAVAAITFSSIVMVMMGVFLFMLLARMVVLWVLIVLSPLAFVLSVIPQTQKYATEWWSEFGANVVTGPVLVFFIWLSFVTVGSGNAHQEIDDHSEFDLSTTEATTVGGGEASGVTKAMSWNSMANFAIAIGMLAVGAKTAQQLGGVGGSAAAGAIDFGKKVATVASGVAAARWAGGKAKEGAVAAGKGLYGVTLENSVERAKMWGQRNIEGYRSWRAQGPRLQRTKMEEGQELTEEEKARGVTIKEEDDGRFKYDFERDEEGNVIDTRGFVQKTLHERQERLVKSKKLLSKVTKQKEVREELMDKRVTADPRYFMQRFEGAKGEFRFNALDRMEQGQLEAEKARSAGKTKEFGAIGKGAVLANERFKDQEWQGKRGSVAKQIAAHEGAAHGTEAEMTRLKAEEEKKFLKSHEGHTIEVRTNLAEQSVVAARAFVDRLKDVDLKHAFEKAAEAIKEAAKQGGESLNVLAERNPYVRALRESKLQASFKEDVDYSKSEAAAAAEAEYVEKGILGYSTPSSSLVPSSKRVGDGLGSLTAQALGKTLADNLAHVAQQAAKQGGRLTDTRMRTGLYGTTSKVNAEAYIDDAIGDMANQFDRLDSGKITDVDQKAKIQALKDVWVNGLKVLKKGDDGMYYGLSKAKSARLIQNYAVTGGDVALMKQHEAIENGMGDGEDYGVAAQRILGSEYERFKEKMEGNETFMKDAASSFKNQALAAGHVQLGGHQMFDTNLGFHRMSTQKEAKAIMQSEVRKRPGKIAYQYHTVGDVVKGGSRDGVLIRVDAQMYGDTIGQGKKYLEMKSIQDRTRDGLMGYSPSEDRKLDKQGYGFLGGELDGLKKKFGDDTKKFLRDVILPQLAKGPKAFGLVAQLKFDNRTSQEAELGKLKIAFHASDGGVVQSNNLYELIKNVEKELGNDLGEFAKDIEEAKKAALAMSTEKPKSGGKKKADDDEDEDADADDQK